MRVRWFVPRLLVIPLVLLSFVAGCVASPTPTPSPIASVTSIPTPVNTVVTVGSPTVTSLAATPTVPPPTATVPAVASSPTPTPIPAFDSPDAIARPPARDPLDIARRLKPGYTPEPTPAAAPPDKVGDRHSFWVLDQNTKAYSKVPARVAYVTDHVYMYVADGIDVPIERLRASGDVFEQKTYPSLHRYFGSEWSPGIDNDVHLTILNARVPGVGGYFSSSDEVPVSINQYSNEREMFYINYESFQPGTAEYDSTLAHEFTHMIQYNVDRGGETWVSEGTAELGVKAAGLRDSPLARYYLDNPDLQLTGWSESPSQTIAHYGAAYLFFDYFEEHFGGFDAIGKLLAGNGTGIVGVDDYLQNRGLSTRFDDIFRDWAVANYLDDEQVANGRYGYSEKNVKAKTESLSQYPARTRSEVYQYGVDYYELPNARGDVTISFAGEPKVKLVPVDPHGGAMEWWSNRGDSIDSRLTRRLDLTKVSKATLKYSVWFDIEENYDYAFVMISTDGGAHWQTVPGRQTTTANPNGGNFGYGYTGRSGGGAEARWIPEEVDLTPFAGREVLLRFEYVTDDAYNAEGLGIDDLSVPEIGLQDDAESDGGWTAEGFTRIRNRAPQDYAVQVITLGKTNAVQQVPLDAQRRGSLTIRNVGPGKEIEKIAVAISGMTPLTNAVAPFELSAQPATP